MSHVLCGLAVNEALPSGLVGRLIAVADADIADGLAGRTSRRGARVALWAPADLTALLACHPHAEVRRAVAANEATPPHLAMLTPPKSPNTQRGALESL